MDWFAKKDEKPEVVEEVVPFNPPVIKTEAHCIMEGCEDFKQLGQNAYCAKHVRAG